ncbi:MAG: hypothetical protein CMO55_27505 [Verrucomicrobiales bacterium]|nr:hypothetical protein [Verrucomicrobiales bacterium]
MNESNRLLRPWIWIVYLILFLFGVPWYWPEGDTRILIGFPLWAVVTVGISFLISCFTAWLFLFRWPEEDSEEEGQE